MDKAISILANNLSRDYYDLISRYREVLKCIGEYSFYNKGIDDTDLLINDVDGIEYVLRGFTFPKNSEHILLEVYNAEGDYNKTLPMWHFENLPIYHLILDNIQAIEFPE